MTLPGDLCADCLEVRLAGARAALARDPDNAKAFAALESFLISSSGWSELAQTYQRASGREADPVRRGDLLSRLGGVMESRLGEPLQAMELYQQAVRLAPSPALTARMEALRLNRPLWEKAVDALTASAESAGSPEEAGGAYVLAASIHLKFLGDEEAAVASYLAVLKADPSTPGVLKILRDLAEKRRDDRILARALAAAAEGAGTAARRRDLYGELGALYRGPLRSPEEALAAYRKALEADPTDAGTRESLLVLSLETGDRDGVRSLLGQAGEAAAKVRLGALGLTLLDRSDGESAARLAFEESLRLDPKHLPALRGLVQLCERTADWPRLIEIYRAFDEALSEEERVKAGRELARALVEKAGSVVEAVSLFQSAQGLARHDPFSWQTVGEALEAAGRWEDFLALCGALPLDQPLRGLAKIWYRKAGDLMSGTLGRPAEAASWYGKAAEIDPSSETLRNAHEWQLERARASEGQATGPPTPAASLVSAALAPEPAPSSPRTSHPSLAPAEPADLLPSAPPGRRRRIPWILAGAMVITAALGTIVGSRVRWAGATPERHPPSSPGPTVVLLVDTPTPLPPGGRSGGPKGPHGRPAQGVIGPVARLGPTPVGSDPPPGTLSIVGDGEAWGYPSVWIDGKKLRFPVPYGKKELDAYVPLQPGVKVPSGPRRIQVIGKKARTQDQLFQIPPYGSLYLRLDVERRVLVQLPDRP